jgi:hypothetical protein
LSRNDFALVPIWAIHSGASAMLRVTDKRLEGMA